MVPTFKETSYPIEEIFQVHTDDVIDSDFSFMDSEPLDIYSRQEIFDEQVQDTVYGTDEEFNTLILFFYDLDHDSDNDDLENDRSVSQCQSHTSLPRTDSKISTFVCTQQNTRSVCLAQVTGKVKRMWVKALFKSEPKVNPKFALDMPIYNKITAISSFSPTVIHASYLHSSPDFYFEDNPEIQLHFDGTVTASTPSGLAVHTLIDTGCHKTLLSKKFYDQNQKHFQNFSEIPFLEKHSITVGNGQQIVAHKMISLPLLIQGHHFEFLALIVDMLDEYDFIIGLEAAIQLEAVYHMTSHIFSVKPRSVLLFPVKDIEISPWTSTSIQLVGDLPCTFSSGPAIIRVQPVQVGYSFNTIEVEFLDQSTCIYVSNKSQKSVYFHKDFPAAYFDLRSIGYFNPSQATKLLSTKTPHTYVTSFAVMQDASNHRLDNASTPVMDTKDPYPWLEFDDPRRFQTDREILELAVDLSQSCLTKTQQVECMSVLEKYKDAFCLRDEIGLAPNMEVHLDLVDKTPFFIRPFTVKEDMKQKIDKEMDRLVQLGILKKGLSGYSSPAMAIPRKNSDIPRVVGDFRYLNKRLVKLNMTFPLVRECIQSIGVSQCEVMSVIDLRDAYHTLRLAPSSQQYTGITPYYGADSYQYLRMAMGLSVSPAIWQTFINNILRQIPHKNRHIAIMDDCLIHSKFADHLQDLINLFESLIKNGLKISPRKCQFFRTQIVYMGLKFLIHQGKPSFTPMKDKCDAIRHLEPPKTVRDCRKFCGMVNFLATFLKNLQKLLIPIYNLTRKNTEFLWTDECQNAFDRIKALLSCPPIL